VFITRRNHAVPVVAHDLEYKSLLAAPDDVESNDFIIDLYPFDPDPLRSLFVGRFQIYWLFFPSSIMKGAVIATDRYYIVRIALVPAMFAVSRPDRVASGRVCFSMFRLSMRALLP
jgi:hypothetical protein